MITRPPRGAATAVIVTAALAGCASSDNGAKWAPSAGGSGRSRSQVINVAIPYGSSG